MNLWQRRLFRRGLKLPRPGPLPEPVPSHAPLPLLVHAHQRTAVPPGPLEEGMIEVPNGEWVLHGLRGFLRPDGSLADLPASHLEWARRLTYQHLKREGCLSEFGIPILPAYEYLALEESCTLVPPLQ